MGSLTPGTPNQHEGFMKGTFGYRMSKKVAELTQVVHMLFTKNHEREAEIDEIKQRYARDMTNIIKVARNALEKADYQIRELERQTQRQKDHVAENTAQLLKDSQEKMELLKHDLAEEKAENHRLRDTLTQTHIDINRLKQGNSGVAHKLTDISQRLNQSTAETKRYKSLLEGEQETNKNQRKNLLELNAHMKAKEEELLRMKEVLEKTQHSLDDRTRRADELFQKVQKMEQEIKFLHRENIKQAKAKTPGERFMESPTSRQATAAQMEELERKNKEIEWLRMELSNREGNFNRVFAKFQPVLVSSERNNRQAVNDSSSKILMVTPPAADFFERNSYHRSTLPSITGLDFDPDSYSFSRQFFHSADTLPRHASAKAKLARGREKSLSPKDNPVSVGTDFTEETPVGA